MEYVKVLWIAVFFLFSLCLVFILEQDSGCFQTHGGYRRLLKSCEEVSATKKTD
jgi:hypothetical protein